MKFLEQVARDFYLREGSGIKEFCFVFPNRRSGLFFRKYLSELTEKPIVSPEIVSFKDFVLRLSDKREADKIELLFDLYKVYSQLSSSPESFDEFAFWGEIVLKDFNDIDNFLIDARQLFSNVKDLKAIESDYSFLSPRQLSAVKSFWEGFLPEGNSEGKKSFRLMWEILHPLYEGFNSLLDKKNAGYEGKIYREVAGHFATLSTALNYKKIVFVGLNAVNECEKKILIYLRDSVKADFYWDYYGPFISDASNKASFFMRDNLRMFPSEHPLIVNERPIPEVEVIGVPSSVIQAKLVGEFLKDCEKPMESAVVLPDERLLMPLLNAVPEMIEDVNITMGYSLSATSIPAMIKQITEIKWEQKGIYFKRALPLLKHTIVRECSDGLSVTLADKINRENLIYLSFSDFDIHPFLKRLFTPLSGDHNICISLCDKILDVMDIILETPGISRINREFVYYVHKAVTRIKGIMIPMSVETFSRLLNFLLERISIPFKGEPLAGLQIMGVLETRALDFETVIICSLNEGMMPKREASNSFIPYNLRRGFSLPVYDFEDAVYSHIFYSLLTRAKRVVLLYDSRNEGVKTGEQSRFILQLKYLYNVKLKEKTIDYKVDFSPQKEIVIEKDNNIIAKLKSLFGEAGESAFSATLLNNYIDCPLMFYFKAVERLEKEDEVTEEVEANEFGSIFHYVMEKLYQPYKDKVVTKELIKNMIDNSELIEHHVNNGFAKYKNNPDPSGYSLIIKKLIIRYVIITLKHDLSIAPFKYLGSEVKLRKPFLTESGIAITLKGSIDRIDYTDKVRIVDYKTGKGDLKFKYIEDLFRSDYKQRNRTAFQMLFYSLLSGYNESFYAEPYFLRQLTSGSIHTMLVESDLVGKFASNLSSLTDEIFDKNIPFSTTKNRDVCKYCNFYSICY